VAREESGHFCPTRVGDVVQVNEMDSDLQADRAYRRFGERRIT
jgi:hypothetical protein